MADESNVTQTNNTTPPISVNESKKSCESEQPCCQSMVWGANVAGALLAAGLAVALLVSFGRPFDIPEALKEEGAKYRINPPAAVQVRIDEARQEADRKNDAFCYALIGAALAGTLGLANGTASGGFVQAFIRLLTGVAYGSVFGAGGGVLSNYSASALGLSDNVNAIVEVSLAHGAAWSCIALAIGFAIRNATCTWCGWTAAFMGPFIGAWIGVFVFPLVGSMFFTERTNLPVPEGLGNIATWVTICSLSIGLVTAKCLTSGRPTSTARVA